MFEKFTDTARAVVILAKDSADDHGQPEVSTGHMLVAIVNAAAAGDAPKTAAVFAVLGTTPETIRDQTAILARAQGTSPGHMPFSQDLKKSLEFALRSSLMLGDNHIGPHHLLAGLVRQTESTAGRILAGLGITEDRIHAAIRDSTPAPSPTAARTCAVYIPLGLSFKDGGNLYPDLATAQAAHPDREITAFTFPLHEGEFFDVVAVLPQNRFKSWGSYASYRDAFEAAAGYRANTSGYDIAVRILVPEVKELRGKDSHGRDVVLGRAVRYARVSPIHRLATTAE